ncbi:MAG: preprotein translocase subunit SecY [Chloroflexi bacterium]|nr:MAG: preprotein translocase subunit SecY [Chloroflexota bacterium]MBL1196665.1 preprotein translocase subunit SecY [Chloroflexota bacterium]NOH13958.1 preprotein translocase subunit SecY [Chloroflexota bacterium]
MKRSSWRFLWSAKDIRRKLLITLGILVIYRFAANVPVPGVDRDVIAGVLTQGGAGAALLQFVNLLSGGSVQNFSVLATGVYPYITAQIILQLLVPIIPALQKRMEEDQREGKKWMERWTYYLAIPMAALQAFSQIQLISAFSSVSFIPNFGFGAGQVLPSLTIIIVMTAGTMFAIWLGELISEYGIRNQGLSLIIMAGIVSQLPGNFITLFQQEDNRLFILGFMIVLTILTVFVIVIVQQGRRNVPVVYPGRRVGRRMSMPVESSLPLMVNMAGMIPLIFAQALLQAPALIASFFVTPGNEGALVRAAEWVQLNFSAASPLYWWVYFLMVVAFAFFYTDVLFAQQNYGENLKRVGARIKGVSPGQPTQDYLTSVLRRITLPGALFLGVVAIMPYLATLLVPSLALSGPHTATFLVSSSGLLIVVGVVRDTFFNIDAELKLHGYDESLLVR